MSREEWIKSYEEQIFKFGWKPNKNIYDYEQAYLDNIPVNQAVDEAAGNYIYYENIIHMTWKGTSQESIEFNKEKKIAMDNIDSLNVEIED